MTWTGNIPVIELVFPRAHFEHNKFLLSKLGIDPLSPVLPAKRGGIADDKRNFIKLIRDLRSAFDSRGTGLVLTAAIGAAASTIDVSYDIPSMYKYLDFVHVMCYDYHGKWDKKTGEGLRSKNINIYICILYTIFSTYSSSNNNNNSKCSNRIANSLKIKAFLPSRGFFFFRSCFIFPALLSFSLCFRSVHLNFTSDSSRKSCVTSSFCSREATQEMQVHPHAKLCVN